jgi:hypothetical protein
MVNGTFCSQDPASVYVGSLGNLHCTVRATRQQQLGPPQGQVASQQQLAAHAGQLHLTMLTNQCLIAALCQGQHHLGCLQVSIG